MRCFQLHPVICTGNEFDIVPERSSSVAWGPPLLPASVPRGLSEDQSNSLILLPWEPHILLSLAVWPKLIDSHASLPSLHTQSYHATTAQVKADSVPEVMSRRSSSVFSGWAREGCRRLTSRQTSYWLYGTIYVRKVKFWIKRNSGRWRNGRKHISITCNICSYSIIHEFDIVVPCGIAE